MAIAKAEIEAAIKGFWDEVAIAEADLPPHAETFPDTLDSVSAVDVLLTIDKIVGFKIEASEVIRRGGYDSKEQFVEHLTAKVLEVVKKHGEGAKK